VNRTQDTGKYIKYTRRLVVCTRRQPVAWLVQPFAVVKICRQTHIDR